MLVGPTTPLENLCLNACRGVKINAIGRYTTVATGKVYENYKQAALAADMESLSVFGRKIHSDMLNFQYNIEDESVLESDVVRKTGTSSEFGSDYGYDEDLAGAPKWKDQDIVTEILRVTRKSDGLKFVVTVFNRSEDFFPMTAARMRQPKYEAKSFFLPILPNFALGPGPDPGKPWVQKTHTLSDAHINFTYDITFPEPGSLGLTLHPHCVRSMGPGMGCISIVDASSLIKSIVRVGDILLSVNGISLVNEQSEFDYAACTRSVATAPAPRTLRFLRIGCTSSVQQLSPIELRLATKLEQPAASYTLHVQDKNGSLHNALKLTGPMDPQWSKGMRDEISGHRNAVGEDIYLPHEYYETSLLLAGYKPYRLAEKYIPQCVEKIGNIHDPRRLKAAALERRACFLDNYHSETGRVYEDRGKWGVNITCTNRGDSDGQDKYIRKSHWLGRWNNEEEARQVLKRAREEFRMTGDFQPKRKTVRSKGEGFRSMYTGSTEVLYQDFCSRNCRFLIDPKIRILAPKLSDLNVHDTKATNAGVVKEEK